jgi:Domain of unknown function (DUF4167)
MTFGHNDRLRDRQTNRHREPNPLTRSYDSHGPDVRIRGTALHIAERYLQLARDAHTGSNPVAAENYLQHAEHYFRLIATAKAVQLQVPNRDVRATRYTGPEDLEDDADFDGLPDRFASSGLQERQGKPLASISASARSLLAPCMAASVYSPSRSMNYNYPPLWRRDCCAEENRAQDPLARS